MYSSQEAGTALLYAKAKMGELLKGIESKYVGSIEGTHVPKQIKTLPEGITHKQSHYAQTLAENKEMIEKFDNRRV